MEPYGPDQDEKIGLFTFYREQAELQNQFKFNLKHQNCNKIIKKTSKYLENQKKLKLQLQDNIKSRQQHTQRKSPKLKQITQENSLPETKRRQYAVSKSVIQIDDYHKLEQKSLKQSKISPYSYQQGYLKAKEYVTHKEEQKQDELKSYKNFSKYLSELDIIKAKKKDKIIVEKVNQNKSNSQLYDKKKQNIIENTIDEKDKINSQFKKLALESQQFGLTELNNSFVPISMHKKQKTGLKSYRKQKQYQAQSQTKKTDDTLQKIRISPNNKVSILESLLKKYDESKDVLKSKKLICVQKLSSKAQKNQLTQANQNSSNMKSQSLPRLKSNINDVLMKEKNKPKQKNMAISLQLQRSQQLRSKYQINQALKEDETILTLNKKIRSQIKRAKHDSHHQMRHYLLMRPSQKEFHQINNNSCRQNSSMAQLNDSNTQLIVSQNNTSLNQNSMNKFVENRKVRNFDTQRKAENNSIQKLSCQQMSFRKQKEIFCKRDQYLKNYKEKLKSNIFRIEKSQDTKIKCLMEEKKKEMIENLVSKLSLV